MEKTAFTNLFAPFDRAGPAEQYRALRAAARTRFQNLSLPTSRSEDWRFTNIATLIETPWELPLADQTIDVRRVPAASAPGAIRLIFANGRLLKVEADPATVPPGVQFDSLAETLQIPSALAQIASDDDSAFTALNTSLLDDGALIVIPDGKIVADRKSVV